MGGRILSSRPPCRGIIDFSGATTFDVSNETIRRLANLPPVFGGTSPGIIVASQDILFGMARMFSILGERTRPNMQVVRTIEEAYEILGITAPQFSLLAMS